MDSCFSPMACIADLTNALWNLSVNVNNFKIGLTPVNTKLFQK